MVSSLTSSPSPLAKRSLISRALPANFSACAANSRLSSGSVFKLMGMELRGAAEYPRCVDVGDRTLEALYFFPDLGVAGFQLGDLLFAIPHHSQVFRMLTCSDQRNNKQQ